MKITEKESHVWWAGASEKHYLSSELFWGRPGAQSIKRNGKCKKPRSRRGSAVQGHVSGVGVSGSREQGKMESERNGILWSGCWDLFWMRWSAIQGHLSIVSSLLYGGVTRSHWNGPELTAQFKGMWQIDTPRCFTSQVNRIFPPPQSFVGAIWSSIPSLPEATKGLHLLIPLKQFVFPRPCEWSESDMM